MSPSPNVSSISPLKGGAGSEVDIYGTSLADAEAFISGVKAIANYNSDYGLSIVVPSGITSGDIEVKVNGVTVKKEPFEFIPAPTITSFFPDTAAQGDTVTINGTNFKSLNGVYFGGAYARYNVIDSVTIKAVVGKWQSGDVIVATLGGSAHATGFVYKGPAVYSIVPTTAGLGDTVLITGRNFINISNVTLGGVDVKSFKVISPDKIRAVVGTGASGNVEVAGPAGAGYIYGFIHTGPAIWSVTPNYSGSRTNRLTYINGRNFTDVKSVKIGGVPVESFSTFYNYYITAKVPAGVSGDIEITTPLGIAKYSGFVWASTPTITSISPAAQKYGGKVTITGTNFYGVDTVSFGGKRALYWTVQSPTTIEATVGSDNSGEVIVTTAGGKASIQGFTNSGPSITSIVPAFAGAGQTVTINGANLDSVQTVKFGSINAASFTIISPTKISANIGSGEAGAVTVTAPGAAASTYDFTFVYPPTIYSVTPLEGGNGSPITINGYYLAQTTSVTVGGKAATIVSRSDNEVKITLATAASGDVVLNTPGGTVKESGFKYYLAPVITAVTPTTGNPETTVTITGKNFDGLQFVRIGDGYGDVKSSSDTKIVFVPQYGKPGNLSVTTIGGVATYTAFKFIPAPTITSFNVTGEASASTVNIVGSYFTDVSAVSFGGVPAKSFKVVSATQITAIPGGGASGSIKVTTKGGAAEIVGFLYYQPPVVTSIAPFKGPVGSLLTISGNNFNLSGVKNVVYIGQVKAVVKTATKTKLQVVVPAGGFGPVSVTNTDISLTGYSNNSFQVTNTFGKASFASKREIGMSSNVTNLLADDFDGDGKPDLLIGKQDSLYILRNSTNKVLTAASFSEKYDLKVNREVYNFTTGDIDGDGRKDIVFNFGRSLGILQNLSSPGKLSFKLKIIEGLSSRDDEQLVLSDIDMDGKPDLIESGTYYHNISVPGNCSFDIPSLYLYNGGGGLTALAIADIDADGKPDLIQGTSYSDFGIFKNSSKPGRWRSEDFNRVDIRYSGYFITPGQIAAKDFDGDGKIDVLEVGSGYPMFVVARNIATKGVISQSSFSKAVGYSDIHLNDGFWFEDINGDGKADIISWSENRIYVASNISTSANIAFSGTSPVTPVIENDRLAHLNFADFDGDGRTDIAACSGYNKNIIIYSNSPAIKPEITSVSPLLAGTGSKITLTGKNFDEVTSVTLGNKPVSSFTVISATKIEAIVGSGASGSVVATAPDGASQYPGFVFAEPPVISSVKVEKNAGGFMLQVTGKNFYKPLTVRIEQKGAASYAVNSVTSLSAQFASGTNGYVYITTPGGTTKSPVPVKADQAIKFSLPAVYTYGHADFVPATTTSGLDITYTTSNAKVATIVAGKVHITGAGSVVITALQPGNATNYNAANSSQTLIINKATLTIRADNKARKAGAANPVLTYTISGFVNGDDKNDLTTQPKLATTAVATSKAGSYPITVSGAVSSNYSFVYVAGNMAVSASSTVKTNGLEANTALVQPIVNSALSPNGDGINDVLFINGIDSYPDNTLTVMDANGTLVYQVQGYNNTSKVFNGHSNKGVMQKQGTYYYILEYKVDGDNKRLTGFVLIKY